MLDRDAELALQFMRAFWRGDVDGSVALCTPEARFIFARSLPYPRECPMREAHESIVNGLFALFDPPGQFTVEVKHVLSRDGQVTVEYSAHGKLANGRDYENDYVMALTIRDGQVAEQRAYTDTQHLARLFGP